ncbi:PrsW family intramembrane metalloprotease [Patescibacteria group bacterium]
MAQLIFYPFFIFFGFLPSIIWLLFFLRKDAHPESNRMILKIFFYGMLAAIPAAFIEFGFYEIISKFTGVIPSIFISIIYWFLGIALIEEVLKYLVVRKKVINSTEFDEPLDIMLYMIIAALGFAALENILILYPLQEPFHFFETFTISSFRFVGATFLHALCSGIVGYFLALSFFETKKRFKFLISGLGIAVFLHGLYNFSIMKMDGNLRFLIPIIILISLALLVSLGFKKVKKMASVCKIK